MYNLARVFFNLASASFVAVIPVLWSRFLFVPAYFYGEGVTRLLRWMLISGVASAGGGVPRVWFGVSVGGIPRAKTSRRNADSFLFVPVSGCMQLHSACIYIRPIVLPINHGGMA